MTPPTCCPTRPTATPTPTSSPTTRTTPRRSPSRSSSTERFDWEGDRPPRRPWNETIIYETHVKGFTKRHPACARTCAAPTPGWPPSEALAYLQAPGRHRRRAAAGPPHRRREVPARPRPDQLLGLQLDRLPRAALARTRPPAAAASRCASSRAWSRRCTARASR